MAIAQGQSGNSVTTNSSVFVGGSSATAISQAISLNTSSSSSSSNTSSVSSSTSTGSTTSQFWSSQTAAISSPTQEVLEINFSSASLSNRLSFETSKFPQNTQVQYSTSSADNWQNVLDASTGQPISVQILDSFPAVLPNPATITGNKHPQHDFEGHWQKVEFQIAPDHIQKVRFILQRNSSGTPPLNVAGQAVDYSLAVQNVNIGYEIASIDDVPRTLPESGSATSNQTFANTTDILGSNLGFSTKIQSATNLTQNTDASAALIWKSEPQPFPDAVVNFYADVRDINGLPQVIDQIFIDPLYTGSNINLYYSTGLVNGVFPSSRDALSSKNAFLNNASINSNGTLNLGNYGTAASVSVDNSYLSFDPSVPWWIGFEFTLGFAQSFDLTNHPLFDCGQFQIGFNSKGVYLSTSHGDVNLVVMPLKLTDPIQIVAAYVNQSLHLSVGQDGVVNSLDIPVSSPFNGVIPQVLTIGSDIAGTIFANSTVDAFILKQETWTNDDFIADPSGYSNVGIYNISTSGSNNALLRYDATLVGPSAPTGLVGGPPFHFENLSWTPIPRKYEMQRGNMTVPTTKASFWKLEITNLRPEISEKFVPVTRPVKTFPPSILTIFNKVRNEVEKAIARISNSDVGTAVMANLSNSLNFLDTPAYVGTGSGISTGFTSTEVYVASDYATSKKLATLGNQWKYTELRPDKTAPRFDQVGTHSYTVQHIKQTSSISYFAGLRQITFSRLQKTAPTQWPQIEETFVDNTMVGSGNWLITSETGGLYSGSQLGETYAQTVSVPIQTQIGVRGIQFAAQQTDPKEISINGEFDEPTYSPSLVSTWTPTGDGKVLGLANSASIIDTALEVSRQVDVGFYADIPINYGSGGYGISNGTWANIEATSATYAQLGKGTFAPSNQGGAQSAPIAVPLGGRIYAAGRVTATETLSQPLWIQIIDSDTGGLLVEQQSNVGKNEIKEWYAGIDLKSFGAKVGLKWGDLTGKIVWPSFNDNFTRANSASLGSLTTGQTWLSGTGGGLTIASNKATVTTVGQESYIESGTPWGTMSFTPSNLITTGSHGSAVPLIDLGGMYIMNDYTIDSNNISANLTTLTTNPWTAGHTYTIQFLPTSQVPVGQQVSGVDPIVQPYSWILKDNGTYRQTYSSARMFGTRKGLMGQATQAFSQFSWVPGTAQVAQSNAKFFLTVPVAGQILSDGNRQYEWTDTKGNKWFYNGKYTYSTAGLANVAASYVAGATFLSPPTSVAPTVVNDGTGAFTAGTYFWKVTALDASGEETTGSSEVTATVALNGTVNISWIASTGASTYNIYRSTASGSERLVGSSTGTSYHDTGDTPTSQPVPSQNTTAGGGTMAVTDVIDNYGALEFSVTQMPNGLASSAVVLAYLNYNITTGKIIQLLGDGTIYDYTNQTTLKTSMFSNPITGPITVRYLSAQTLSSAFKSTWSIGTNDTQAMVFLQNNVVVGVYSGTGIWDTTIRGIGGANNGTAGNAYTIIEGFGWYPDGSLIAPVSTSATWASVSYSDTRTYAQMSLTILGSTKNIAVRIVQKGSTLDSWFVQSCTVFWDPVIWEFSCDGGTTFWEAYDDIRNNPKGVMLFPPGLTNYGSLMWRVTSYSGDVTISHLAVRPWYKGSYSYLPPRPTQLPIGPNAVPTDHYDVIENDPRWQTWDLPVPRWWWLGQKQLVSTGTTN